MYSYVKIVLDLIIMSKYIHKEDYRRADYLENLWKNVKGERDNITQFVYARKNSAC